MSLPRIPVPQVKSLARKQLDGLTQRPDLDKAVPNGAAVVKASLRSLEDLEEAQEMAKKTVITLTQRINEAAFHLREQVESNIDKVRSGSGRYAPEILLLGGKPRKGSGRRPRHEEAPPGPSGTPPSKT